MYIEQSITQNNLFTPYTKATTKQKCSTYLLEQIIQMNKSDKFKSQYLGIENKIQK